MSSGMVRKLWHGKYPLALALFGFYCLGGVCVVVLTVLVMAIFAKIWFAFGFVLGSAVLLIYLFVATVGVWRSARVNLESQVKADRIQVFAARGLVLFADAHILWKSYSSDAMWAWLK